jgi:AcrR family transcriptional regulator
MRSTRYARRSEGEREERRDQLVDAAIAAIRSHGAGASMEQLAAEAGVTKPILYRHFGDREGLVRAIGARYIRALMAELRAALNRSTEPFELLTATIDTYVAFIERDPDMYRFLARQAGSVAPVADRELVDFIRQIGQEITVVMGEQLRDAGLDSGPAEAWSFGIVGMVHLAGDWWLDRQTMPRTRLVAYLVDLLWNGIQGVAARAAEAPDAANDVIPIDAHREVSGK